MGSNLLNKQILSRLDTKWIGKNTYYFSEIGSTNQALKEKMAAEDIPVGTVYVTDFQNKGKGRLDRRWLAPRGSSLLLSILFKPEWPMAQIHWLTMIGCLAAIEAIKEVTQLEVSLKWPNDLMVYHEAVWRKIAGILVEGAVRESGVLKTAVFGLGLNVNIPVDELPQAITPTSSLLVASGKKVDRAELLISLLHHIELLYEQADKGESPLNAWQNKIITIGKQVQATSNQGQTVINGIAEGVDELGQLLIRQKSGDIHVVQAADVTLRNGI